MVIRCLLLAFVLCAPAFSAELAAKIEPGGLGIRIVGLTYPADLPKDLTSGLTSRLYARVSLMASGGALLERRTVEIAVRYELWDETWLVTTLVDGRVIETRVLRDLAQTQAFLAAPEIPRLFGNAPSNRDLVLRAELLLNPIDREKLRMLRKWVADNSTPEAGGEAASSTSNALFNRIFEQYADGEQLAAKWHLSLDSRPFRVNARVDERH